MNDAERMSGIPERGFVWQWRVEIQELVNL